MMRSGSSLILQSISTWLGDILMVKLVRLLYTAVVIESHLFQSVGCPPVTTRKYCSIHWFFHSGRPSVCRWNAVDRFCLMLSVFARSRLKCEVKCGSRLLMIFVGSPNHW